MNYKSLIYKRTVLPSFFIDSAIAITAFMLAKSHQRIIFLLNFSSYADFNSPADML